MKTRVSVTAAAKEIGCAPQLVRMKMKAGDWDLGEVVKPNEINGKQFFSYLIFRPKLDRFLGKGVNEDVRTTEIHTGAEPDTAAAGTGACGA